MADSNIFNSDGDKTDIPLFYRKVVWTLKEHRYESYENAKKSIAENLIWITF